MVDLLTLAIIYAILNVASSISSNVASSGIFKLLKPRIFKDKGLEEVKEALNEVVEDLRKKGLEEESGALKEKIDEVTEKTLEVYTRMERDLTQVKDEILDAVKRNFDETKGNLEAVEELKRIVLEYDLPKPYEIVTEGVPEFKVLLRPPFEVEPVERPEGDEWISSHENLFIIGKPGVGKTLLLQEIAQQSNCERIVWVRSYFSEIDTNRLLREDLLGRVLVVWDDVQNNAEVFYRTVYKVRDKGGEMRVVCAARSTELERVEKVPVSFWNDFEFTRIEVPLLHREQRKELIRRCSEKTGIKIGETVVEKLAEKSDGTPLYIISVFLDERYQKAGKILAGDVEALPAEVVDLWKEYYERLEENEKALLRCLMILSKVV